MTELKRLELPSVWWDIGASSVAGLALLKECEKRSISVLCRYGYVYVCSSF